jgi:hypothetical protein
MEALEAQVFAADRSVVFLAPWLLEKIVWYDRGGAAGMFGAPRLFAHVIGRERLLEIVTREELPFDAPPVDQPTLILLARPETDRMLSISGPDMLLRYWRLLFHAKVRATIAANLSATPIARSAVQQRIERMGRGVFNEARYVLQRERFVSAYADDAEVYAEFAAVYLEFTCFAPEPLPWFFPAIEDPTAVLKVLAEEVDAQQIQKTTRPPGAADPHGGPGGAERQARSAKPPRRIRRDAKHREGLLSRAERADGLGNDVRAAIFRMRVYRASGAPGPSRDAMSAVYADALKDLDQLVARLKAALHLDDSLARQWRAWLAALLENAAGGWWNAEGRLLYDLQKVCVYHEREIYSVNVMDYLLDWGRQALRRPQPGQRLVLTVKALRSALRRTARARLSPHGRSELARLLRAAIHDVEERLRHFLRPGLTQALADGGLRPDPHDATETVAHAKLTEELLDETVESGYLTFAGVRDAVSRNQMKLDDLSRRSATVPGGGGGAGGGGGDQLLRIDRRLEENLDYVYHRGEVYRRWFQRVSSLFFATRAGRFLTRFAVLPFGGAFLILEALDHSVGLLIRKVAHHQHLVAAAASSAGHVFGPTRADLPPPHEKIFNQWWLLVLLGLFLFGLINAPPFRRGVAAFFRRAWRAVRALLIDLPRWVATRPLVQAFFRSQFARLFFRYVFKPLALAGFVYVFLPDTVSDRKKMFTLAGVFLVVNVMLNSRMGRALEQALLHTLRTTFARLTWEVLVAVVRRIAQVFHGLLEWVDRVLYAVDELLRFRAGQRRSTVAAKAVVGVFWFFIAYVTRFVINLLVEPQINPIKHFPVVTVSHKLLFPLIFPLKSLFQTVGVAEATAFTYATSIIWCIPGIFGFLAWEFKENWKLYKANRSRTLRPVHAGSHGETVAQFLRPGLHSGTVPKIFHKLRKLQMREEAPFSAAGARHLEAAHHVRHALAAFFDREFIALLNQHPLFSATPIVLGNVHLAATMIRVELDQRMTEAALSATPLILSFEQRAGWIIAGVDAAGWSADVACEQGRLLSAALLGLYKMAGADIVREQVQALFPEGTRFDFRRDDLVVWPTADFGVEAAYDLSTVDDAMTPRFATAMEGTSLPTLRPEQVLFRRVAVEREGWRELWEATARAEVAEVEMAQAAVAGS